MIIASAFVVCLSLLFARQWDRDDIEPLRTWDWDWRTMRAWAPPSDFRRWFVRAAPGLVLAGLMALVGALLFLR